MMPVPHVVSWRPLTLRQCELAPYSSAERGRSQSQVSSSLGTVAVQDVDVGSCNRS